MHISARYVPFVFALGALFLQHPFVSYVSTQSTFRAGVDLVEVDVTVLDKDRKPVRGLTAADFTVFEDGKARQVAAFTAVDVPAYVAPAAGAAAWTSEVVSDVMTNALPEEGRLLVLLMDRSIPDGVGTINARDIARNAVKEMGPNDVAAVVYSGGNGVPQNFTSDRARLIAAIDGSNAAAEAGVESDAQFLGLVEGYMEERAASTNPGLDVIQYSAECMCGACVMDTIGRIADAVRDVGRRRKSLLFIGKDIQVENASIGCVDIIRKNREKMFQALDVSSLTVHSLDPGGLETNSLSAVFSGRMGNSMAESMRRSRGNLVAQGNISVLPDRTGGQVVKNTNAPEARVANIIHESDSYYLLGFVPGTAPDGKRHDIRVRVNKKDVDVRTRRAYIAAPPAAPRGAPPAASAATAREGEGLARRAIEGLLPKRDNLVIAASVATLAAADTRASVVSVALNVTHAATGVIASGAAPAPEQVDVITDVFTLTGRVMGQFKQTLQITPRSNDGSVTYDLVQRLPIKPGQYELRTGIYNEARRQTGSVYAYVQVPNYANARFLLSDVLVHAGQTPTARRIFTRSESIGALVRVFQENGKAPELADMTARVVDAGNRSVFSHEATLRPSDFSRTAVADHRVDVPLATLEPGEYLLTIEGRVGQRAVTKPVRFTVK